MTRTRLAVLIGVVILIAGSIPVFRYYQYQRWRFDPIPLPERLARVTGSWTAADLGRRLQRTGKIRDTAAFVEAAREIGLKQVEPGAWLLPERAGPRELATLFAQPAPLRKVTIPEGWTGRQIALRLQSLRYPAATAFLGAMYPSDGQVSSWEGTLFPDTYYLPVKASAPQLAERLRARYREITARLPRPFPAGYLQRRLDLREVTILASLVEREAASPQESPLIAGVLLARLRKRMRLQCDASVQYAWMLAGLRQGGAAHQNRLLHRHLRIESPYNTYLHYGLPPGAICNPGEVSLRAAARPATTSFLYYVMSPRLKRHRFARTFAEHRRNIRLAAAERQVAAGR